MEQSSIINCNF